MQPVKTGIIGAGHFGRNYARILASLPEAEVVGIMDADADKAAALAGSFAVPAVTSMDELMDLAEAVAIVVPAAYHAAVCRQALERGLHVMMEKPFVLEPDEAGELTLLAESKGLRLQIGHVERFNPAVASALEIAAVNRPVFIQAQRLFSHNPRIADVGVVMDAMIHDLDLMLAFAGNAGYMLHAAGVSRITPFEDLVQATISFDGGPLCSVTASRLSSRVSRRLDITLEDGCLEVDCPGQKLFMHRGGSSESIPVREAEPLKEELLQFLRCVHSGDKPLVSGQEGGRAVTLACRILETLKLSETEGVKDNAENR